MKQLLGFADYRLPGQRLAAEMGLPYQEVGVHRFPDGEHKVTLPFPIADSVIVCRTLFDPNEKLVDLLLLAETARTLGATELILVAPYLCYMRQDKAFNQGEAISQKIIGRLLADMFDTVITVDPHMHRTPKLANAVPSRQSIALSAAEPIAKRLADSGEKWLLAGPDEESDQWVSNIARLCGYPYIIGKKERHGDRDVSTRFPNFDNGRFDIEHSKIALIDDIISTGHTLAEASGFMLSRGAPEVQCFATHLLPGGGAAKALARAGISRIVCTDSIEQATINGNDDSIHLAPLLARTLRQAHPS